jgi:AraC-like DNA-binding protein
MMDETWDTGMLSLPERSRLYHLKPAGIGTPYVENLTSYIIRLAEEHCVLPKILIVKEVLPLLTQTGEPEEPALFSYGAVLGNAQALNGMGIMATSSVYALEKLTKWKDLHLLTMLPWANVISKYGLCRETQAWCPLCFEEWRANKCVMYTPLLWSLKALRVCLHHKRLLHEKCPSLHCNKTIPVLHPHIRLGYCPYCNCWLGNTADMEKNSTETVIPDEFEREMWYATAIGELLEVVSRLSSTLQKEDLALAVDSLINRMPIKKAVYLTRLLERKSVQTVALWQKGLEIPRMNTLLQMCHLLDTSLQQLFLRESDGELITISEERKKFNREMNPVHTKTPCDPEELRRALEKVLASDEEPFPSITEVAQSLGYCNRSSLYKRFPELAYAITTKYQKNRKSHPEQKMSSDELRQALERILSSNEEPPPSIREVAQRLGYRGVGPLYARFPELAREIAAKYRKRNPRLRAPLSLEELRHSLEAELASKEEPPPSLHEVAHRLGYRHAGPLRRRLPELARAIAAKDRRHSHSQRESMSSEELQQALEAELASKEEPPPSIHEVAQRLGYRHAGPLRSRFPDLSRAITQKHQNHNPFDRKRKSSAELRRALESILASNEEPPPSIHEVAQRLGYRGANELHKRFPDLANAIVTNYQKYDPSRKKRMSSVELQQMLESILASNEEPSPSIQEVAHRLGYHGVSTLYSRFPDLSHAITAKYQRHNPGRREPMDAEALRQSLEAILASNKEPPPSIREVALRLGYRSESTLYYHFPELTHKIVAKHRKYTSHYKERVGSSELQQALEAVLASEEEPFPSIQEVAQRLGYRSEGTLFKRFPDLSHAIAVKSRKHTFHNKERVGSGELQQALEAVLASEEEPPLSVPEVAQHLGYRSERALYKRFPELSRSIAERYHKYKYNREEIRNLDELRQALEVVLASEEEPFPSMNEVARFLGYCSPTFLYKHFPDLSRAITSKKRRSGNLPQKLEVLLKEALPTITQQEIAKQLGCSIKKLHRHFPELSSNLKQRFIQSLDLEAVQETLEKELATENEVRSLSAVARDLGYPVQTLTKFFPSLCQRIIVRGQLYRKEHSALRKQKIQEEVQRVVFTINADQQYPSLDQILKRIDRSCVDPPIYYLEAYVPWKKSLENLGY